jgi:hypothetical protein
MWGERGMGGRKGKREEGIQIRYPVGNFCRIRIMYYRGSACTVS